MSGHAGVEPVADAPVADAEARLRALEDRAELAELIARYGPIVDAGQGELLGELWTPDGRYAIGDEFSLAGEQVPALTELPDHRAYLAAGCGHLLTAPTLRVDGDSATGVNHSFVLVRDGERWVVDRASANEWTFTRTAEGWRVALRRNRLLDGSPEARALLTPPALR